MTQQRSENVRNKRFLLPEDSLDESCRRRVFDRFLHCVSLYGKIGYSNTRLHIIRMAEVDYGYGDQLDYGYGDVKPDMMATGEKAATFYSGPDADMYGYGNENDATMSNSGHIESEPSFAKRPKRRCSVTKFTLESGAPTMLTAASVIADMRNAGVPDNSTEAFPTEGCTGSSDAVEARMNEEMDELEADGETVRGVKKRGSVLRIFGMNRK
jgi:hypothetical protein